MFPYSLVLPALQNQYIIGPWGIRIFQNTDLKQHNKFAGLWTRHWHTGMCLTTTKPDENPGKFLDCNNENGTDKHFRMVACKTTYDKLYTVQLE